MSDKSVKKSIDFAIIGRSNAGKSTLVSMLLDDHQLGSTLYQNNEKGKTKLNTKYCLHSSLKETCFEIKQNLKIAQFYFISKSSDDEDKTKHESRVIKSIIDDFKKLFPEIKTMVEYTMDDFLNSFGEIVKTNIEKWEKYELAKFFELSEEYPIIRNLIELVVVHTNASDIAKNLIKKFELEFISIIDTKGFGDTTSLIEYEFPQVDVALFMISDKYIDSDYKAMQGVILDQVKKIPTILCARGQKLRIEEIECICQDNDTVSCFDGAYADGFSDDTTPAATLKKYLIENQIIHVKNDARKSVMELYLSENDIFRTVPYILKDNEKSGRVIVTEREVENCKNIYTKLVENILDRAINAKIREDKSINDLIEKLNIDAISNSIGNDIMGLADEYITAASISPVTNNKKDQYTYMGRSVINTEKFIDTVHRYIHGPRGGTTGYYAYNYDRLAISSYVCLEKCFEKFQKQENNHLDSAQIELIIRKVRRDICRYGKLAGASEDYKAYIDFDKLCKAYDQEESKDGPWKGNFYEWNYAYEKIRQEVRAEFTDANLNKAQHAASIYYGVIRRTVLNSINQVLNTMTQDIQNLIIK